MLDRSGLDHVLASNRYLVLGTTDAAGAPWVTPVFFAPVTAHRLCWVSSPESRHSRNIAQRSRIAITVFDSGVEVGAAEAAYFDADASVASGEEGATVVECLNSRLPPGKRLVDDDLSPGGRLVAYLADLRRSYVLVRGGDEELGNAVDMTVEV